MTFYRVVQYHDDPNPALRDSRPLAAAYQDRAQAEALAADDSDPYWNRAEVVSGTINAAGDFEADA